MFHKANDFYTHLHTHTPPVGNKQNICKNFKKHKNTHSEIREMSMYMKVERK